MLCADDLRFSMFSLITRDAKETLSQRANETLNAILSRISEIVIENIASVT